jgi:hypothetical protein
VTEAQQKRLHELTTILSPVMDQFEDGERTVFRLREGQEHFAAELQEFSDLVDIASGEDLDTVILMLLRKYQ